MGKDTIIKCSFKSPPRGLYFSWWISQTWFNLFPVRHNMKYLHCTFCLDKEQVTANTFPLQILTEHCYVKTLSLIFKNECNYKHLSLNLSQLLIYLFHPYVNDFPLLLNVWFQKISILPPWMVSGISKGKGSKRPTFPKCRIIFPEGHEKLTIFEHVHVQIMLFSPTKINKWRKQWFKDVFI